MTKRKRAVTPEEMTAKAEQLKAYAAVIAANKVPIAIGAAGAGLAALSVNPRIGYHIGRGVGILAANIAEGIASAAWGSTEVAYNKLSAAALKGANLDPTSETGRSNLCAFAGITRLLGGHVPPECG